jgi:hypothetical protein
LDTSSFCWLRVIRVIFCVSGVFIFEGIDGVGDKGSGKYNS